MEIQDSASSILSMEILIFFVKLLDSYDVLVESKRKLFVCPPNLTGDWIFNYLNFKHVKQSRKNNSRSLFSHDHHCKSTWTHCFNFLWLWCKMNSLHRLDVSIFILFTQFRSLLKSKNVTMSRHRVAFYVSHESSF